MVDTAQKRPKILYLITKSNWGGAQRYVFDLASHFSQKYDVVVGLGGAGPLKTALEEAGIRTFTLPSVQRDIHPMKEVRAFFELVSMIRAEKPDIVHLNSSKIGGLGGLACRVAGIKKIIFTAHGWAFNEDRALPSRALILFLHWITVLLCTQTVAVSQKTAEDIAHLPFMADRIRIIHNGLTPVTRYSKTEARRLLSERAPELKQKQTKTVWIGTISELHPNKGLLRLIRTIETIQKQPSAPHLAVIIIGEGEQRSILEATIKETGLQQTVFLLGALPNAAEYLNALDIFTLTSVTEGLPYVLLEAGAAHLPVVASAVGGIPEVIRQLESGILVRPGDHRELTEAIALLAAHPETRARLGKTLQRDVTEQFSSQQMFEKTEQVYL